MNSLCTPFIQNDIIICLDQTILLYLFRNRERSIQTTQWTTCSIVDFWYMCSQKCSTYVMIFLLLGHRVRLQANQSPSRVVVRPFITPLQRAHWQESCHNGTMTEANGSRYGRNCNQVLTIDILHEFGGICYCLTKDALSHDEETVRTYISALEAKYISRRRQK